MPNLLNISFTVTLIYFIILIIRVAIVGYKYDTEKKKTIMNYNGNHSAGKFGEGMWGQFVIPWPIQDDDPSMAQHVKKYNRLAKTFWVSILIGVPLLIYLGSEINKS